MSDTARQRILSRLENAWCEAPAMPAGPALPEDAPCDREALIDGLKSRMEAVKTEIHVVAAEEWLDTLAAIVREKRIGTLLYGPESNLGQSLQEAWQRVEHPQAELIAYGEPVEAVKKTLFEVDAGITVAAGAVADTGALILRPGIHEPRLMSLVPPVHIAVLDAADIYTSMAAAMQKMQWAEDMPTNLLMISGPSKTADIEFTLTFGVHGPKALIVIIRT
jgi:L-lactate dehydrogenase complex protein LldG